MSQSHRQIKGKQRESDGVRQSGEAGLVVRASGPDRGNLRAGTPSTAAGAERSDPQGGATRGAERAALEPIVWPRQVGEVAQGLPLIQPVINSNRARTSRALPRGAVSHGRTIQMITMKSYESVEIMKVRVNGGWLIISLFGTLSTVLITTN